MEVRLSILFVLLASCHQAPSIEQADKQAEQAFEQKVRDAVRAELRDPESAKIESKFGQIFPSDDLYCGEVNSRNGYGGYTGFQDFVYFRGKVVFAEGDSSEFVEAVSHCIEREKIRTKEAENRAAKAISELEKIDPKAAQQIREGLATPTKE